MTKEQDMQKRIRIISITVCMLLAFCSSVVATGKNMPHDSVRIKRVGEIPPHVMAEVYRTFDGLDHANSATVVYDPIVVSQVVADSVVEKQNYAHALLEKVQSTQRFVETLDALTEIDLPVGIAKSGGSVDYTILIDRITFTTQGALMEVYVSLALPQSGDRIAFNGKIPLSKEGGIAGDARVYLLGDHPIKLNGTSLLTIKGTNNSYVEFNCNGFKGVSIEAEIQFSRELIVPEDEKGNIKPDPERVKVSFITYAQSLNDLMVGVNIPPFQVTGLKGVGFSVSQAFMDWSDLANPPGLAFPQGYTSPFLEAGTPKLWQGFYLQRLEVRLPPSFTKNRSDGSRIKLGLEHTILDDQGFTGAVFAENVLEAGDMSGWAYTLDRVSIDLITNQIRGFELAGKISIPVVKAKDDKSTQFGYRAQRGADGNYIFAVSITNELKLPLFVADLKLYNGSTIVVKEKENRFYPSAMLNGELTINALSKGPKVSFNSIRFEQMVISSEAPHFRPGNFGFGKEGASSSASGYPLVINNIMLKSEKERVGIGFDVTINIGGKSEDEGFGGTAALVVWGKQEVTQVKDAEGKITDEKEDWKFDKVEISGVGISIKKPGVIELAGMIRFFDEDPTYGSGFKGSLDGKIQMISVKAEALFGKTPTFRYWYADALVEIKSGIVLAPGFAAYGFGGGFYSKMKQSTGSGGTLGTTPSGVTYVPDENTIGIKALVMFGTAGRPEAFNGDVSLEVMLNTHGGINSVTLKGNARFMAGMLTDLTNKIKENVGDAVQGKALNKLMQLAQGQVYGSVLLQYDNVNSIFHGNLEIYVNVAGGLVRGVSPGNLAGWATIHFSKEEWYILIGTPDKPIGLEVARIIKSTSYFMMGDNLPGSPPPPKQVSEILGNIDLDYMRDLNALSSGTGFAFGLRFGVDTGDLKFLMFYGRFAAGTGIDFMLKNYGDNYHCQGSSGPIGISGWYANGQAYAFVQGKIGIRVNLRFYKGNFDILSIGAAAVMQAKGPNPFWMRGIVGGYYRILGGLVKGNCRFEVTIGDDCKIVGDGNPLEGVSLISEISPVKGEKDVDVFNAPQAAFNIPLGEEFVVTDIDNNKHTYRGNLASFTIVDGTSPVEGTVRWNATKDVAAFDSRDVLPPKKELKAVVKVAFEEKTYSGWQVVMYDGKPAEEIKETSFTTGEAPDHIPASNVDFSYPVVGQYNFHPQEYNQGFIILKKGQPYLFKPGVEWIQKIHMLEAESQRYLETDVAYNESEKKVQFNIPAGLVNTKAYQFDILNIPAQQNAIDKNVKQVETNLASDGGAVLTTKKIEGTLELRDVKSIYTTYFRTSKYNTFSEKMRAMSLSQALSGNPGNNVLILGAYWRGDEYFDAAEIGGGTDVLTRRLITLEADVTGNTWYQQAVYPLLYQDYPIAGSIQVRNRDVSVLGLPPLKDVYLGQDRTDLQMTTADIPDPQPFYSRSRVEYQMPISLFHDYYDLQNQVANYIVNTSSTSPRLNLLLVSPYPLIDYGTYRVKINYRIPGIKVTTSTLDVNLLYSRTSGSN
jgi:hypothetical protein